MSAYYNELDPLKAEILREAIKDGAIAPGEVDERSIADVEPTDLVGFAQCHFFAGGGFWSLALRLAGWRDDWECWTGSCPCPSFSAAGKGQGFDDPRHLWPYWARLITERRPAVIFGEQVSAAIGHGWLDLVQTDLETQKYAVGKAVLGACSVGAPHIRQRLFFVAELADAAISRRADAREHRSGQPLLPARSEQRSNPDGLAESAGERHDGRGTDEAGTGSEAPERCGSIVEPERSRHAGIVVDAAQRRRGECWHAPQPADGGHADSADIAGILGEPERKGLEGHTGHVGDRDEPGRFRKGSGRSAAPAGSSGGLADADGGNAEDRRVQRSGQYGLFAPDGGPSFVADTGTVGRERRQGTAPGDESDRPDAGRNEGDSGPERSGQDACGLADASSERRQQECGSSSGDEAADGRTGRHECQPDGSDEPASDVAIRSVADASGGQFPFTVGGPDQRNGIGPDGQDGAGMSGRPGPLNGYWRDADWIGCRDGKFRPVESRTFPLVNGSPARVGRLRLYGDAICVPAAQAFIEAYLGIGSEEHA